MRVGCGRDARLARFVTALLIVVASIALMIPRGDVAFSQTSTPSITKLFYATDLQVLGMAEQELFHFTLPANTLSDTASLVAHIKMVGFLGNGDARGIDVRGYIGAAEVWDTDTVDWTFNQVVRVTVQGLGPNEGWEGYVIATLEGQ